MRITAEKAQAPLAVARRPPYPDTDRESLARVVYKAFSQRRKTLRNSFKGSLEDSDFDALQIDPNARAETLDIEAFVNMTHKLSGLRRV